MIRKVRKNNDCYDVRITDKNKNTFIMTMGGNLDLYWLPEDHRKNTTFIIDKTDKLALIMFDRLFDAINTLKKPSSVLVDDTLTFVSEDRNQDEANTLTITKKDKSYIINFNENENKKAWTTPHRDCTICFCNNGSNVPDVEYVFMQMYKFLANYYTIVPCDDPSDEKEPN